jgi:hypothetical protein
VPPDAPVIVYISAGNSDDRLTQNRWSELCWNLHSELELLSVRFLGEWASDPVSPWQNACWAVEFESPERATQAKAMVACIGRSFGQDAIAWAPAPRTEMV